MCFKKVLGLLKRRRRQMIWIITLNILQTFSSRRSTQKQWFSWCLSAEVQEGKLRNHRGKSGCFPKEVSFRICNYSHKSEANGNKCFRSREVTAVGGKNSSYMCRRKLRMELAGRRAEEEHMDEMRGLEGGGCEKRGWRERSYMKGFDSLWWGLRMNLRWDGGQNESLQSWQRSGEYS